MTLNEYRALNGLTIPQLADSLAMPYYATVSLVYSRRYPSVPIAQQIHRATGGTVGLMDWKLKPQTESPKRTPRSL